MAMEKNLVVLFCVLAVALACGENKQPECETTCGNACNPLCNSRCSHPTDCQERPPCVRVCPECSDLKKETEAPKIEVVSTETTTSKPVPTETPKTNAVQTTVKPTKATTEACHYGVEQHTDYRILYQSCGCVHSGSTNGHIGCQKYKIGTCANDVVSIGQITCEQCQRIFPHIVLAHPKTPAPVCDTTTPKSASGGLTLVLSVATVIMSAFY